MDDWVMISVCTGSCKSGVKKVWKVINKILSHWRECDGEKMEFVGFIVFVG